MVGLTSVGRAGRSVSLEVLSKNMRVRSNVAEVDLIETRAEMSLKTLEERQTRAWEGD